MALTLVATPGAADANAYADVATAVAAARYRPDGAAFIALTSDQQVQALVTTAADIDTIGDDFIGERATDDQSMEWPRSGTDFEDDELPVSLVKANIAAAIEAAASIKAGTTILSPDPVESNIKRKKVDALETEYFNPMTAEASALTRFSAFVQRLLAPLIAAPLSTGWGSATVTRGS